MSEQLTGAEIDTLYALAREYPHGLEAGNTPSKVGRDSLIRRGWASYHDGVTYLNQQGKAEFEKRKRTPESGATGGATGGEA